MASPADILAWTDVWQLAMSVVIASSPLSL